VTLSGRNLWVHTEDVSILGLPNINLLWDLQKRDDNLFSRKIKDAQLSQVNGYFMRSNVGHFCNKVVDNGVVFVGDASGNCGIIHGMISGYYAAIAAREAIKEKNIGRLMEYDQVLRKSDIYRYPYYWRTMRKEYLSFAGLLEKMKGIQL
jgi:flavin-dependent dehydrogenase